MVREAWSSQLHTIDLGRETMDPVVTGLLPLFLILYNYLCCRLNGFHGIGILLYFQNKMRAEINNLFCMCKALTKRTQ